MNKVESEKRRPQYVPKQSGGASSTSKREASRCFNCYQEGHRASNCTKPKREWGTCFRHGLPGHRVRDCKADRATAARKTSTSGATAEAVSSVTQNTATDAPYLLDVWYTAIAAQGDRCDFKVSAMIDSGSPVSLLKIGYVPLRACQPLTDKSKSSHGSIVLLHFSEYEWYSLSR